MSDKPLFIVDMTLYEFQHILGIINEVNLDFPQEERRFKVKEFIFDMFGKIPISEGKPPRRVVSAKKKMTQNYMITLNQLDLIDNKDRFNELYNLYRSNLKLFYQKLRDILLIIGNWNDYLDAMKKVNQLKTFHNKTEYLNLVAREMHKNCPSVSIKGHFKQITYVKRWMKHQNLQIIGGFTTENGMELLENKPLK